MQNRLKTLEKLVFEACHKVRKLESENHALQLQTKGLSRELERMQHFAVELRDLREWRDGMKTKLKKVSVKVERALERVNR
ncbi:MAG: hypothetical protein PHP45_10460 [Elusimicrobiales bacterium]|nr:hypothetical protein [Elusimicrobiales bacterium]